MSTLTSPAAIPVQRSKDSLVKQLFAHPLSNYYLVLAAGTALVCFGVVMVTSASSVFAQAENADPYFYGRRQIIFALAGAAFAWLTVAAMNKFGPRFLRLLAWPALILALVLVVLTFSPLAVNVGGNTNWLQFGPTWTRFQPSEFAKLALVIWGAQHLAIKQEGKLLDDLREWLLYVGISLLLIGLVMLNDLGSATVMTLMLLGILFLAGAPLRLIGGVVAAGSAAIGLLCLVQPDRMGSILERVTAWLNPDSYALSHNFQARHGLYALASGGWWGEGLGASKQKWGALETTAHTDYILAIVGEELGLAGTLTVIGLFLLLGFAGIRIAGRLRDTFLRLVATGVTCWFLLQALINIAVVFTWLPVLGVTLPLVSYGGSSLLATMIALGILVGCARQEEPASQLLAAPEVPRSRVMTIFSRSSR